MGSNELLDEFQRQRETIYAYVLALTADHDAAEEVLQEMGVSVLGESRRGTVPDDAAMWFRGLARHQVADHYRRSANRRRRETHWEELADVVEQAFTENPVDGDPNGDQLELLKTCLDELTDRVRTMINLRYTLEKSIDDIAIAMSWTPASVKVALSRARRALADCMNRKARRAEALL